MNKLPIEIQEIKSKYRLNDKNLEAFTSCVLNRISRGGEPFDVNFSWKEFDAMVKWAKSVGGFEKELEELPI